MTIEGELRVPRWAWIALAIGAALFLTYQLRAVLTPICLALSMAYVLNPAVDYFCDRNVPRSVAITVVLAIILTIGAVFVVLIVPSVIAQVVRFSSELPNELRGLRDTVDPLLAEYDLELPRDFDELLVSIDWGPGDLAANAAEPIEAIAQYLLGGTITALGVIAGALIVPVLAFYLLYDFDSMIAGARDLLPQRARPFALELAAEIDDVLGHFVRGQVVVMVIVGCLYALTYWLAGVRLAVPIGIVAGLLAFIPFVGSMTALSLGLFMCVVDWTDWWKPVWVLVAYSFVQSMEGWVLVPRIVGDRVGLPAFWVIIALMIGGELFGFLGVILALPAASVIKIFVVRGVRWYLESDLYRGKTAPEISTDTVLSGLRDSLLNPTGDEPERGSLGEPDPRLIEDARVPSAAKRTKRSFPPPAPTAPDEEAL